MGVVPRLERYLQSAAEGRSHTEVLQGADGSHFHTEEILQRAAEGHFHPEEEAAVSQGRVDWNVHNEELLGDRYVTMPHIEHLVGRNPPQDISQTSGPPFE